MTRRRLIAVARKEAIQLRRDPRSLALAFILPPLLVLLFGYAISFDVNRIDLAVLDHDHSQQSRSLVEAFRQTGVFVPVVTLVRDEEIAPLLARRGAQAVVVIPPTFSADLRGPAPAPVQLVLDGADAATASVALSYALGVGNAFTATMQGAAPAGSARVRVWYNEDLDSRVTIVPGLVAVVMMIIAAMLTSLTIAREWERGTMEQLAATPVEAVEVVLGKLVPYLGIGLFDVTMTVVLGLTAFHVPFRGSPLLLLAASLLFLIGGLGLGIAISARARSQVMATQIAMLTTYLPGFLLSGFAFDIAGMPVVLRGLSYAVSARYFIVVTRGIFLKGVGLPILWPQFVALTLFAVVGLGFAIRSFRKEIEP